MSILAGIFLFGLFVTTLVMLGLVMAVSALNDGSFGGFEGRALNEGHD